MHKRDSKQHKKRESENIMEGEMTTDIANPSVYSQKKNCVGEKLP